MKEEEKKPREEKIKKWWQFWIQKPIWKMATIYECYREYGYPKFPQDKGKIIEVPMRSGKIGIYKLIGSERAWNVDWDWLLWELQGYKLEQEQK